MQEMLRYLDLIIYALAGVLLVLVARQYRHMNTNLTIGLAVVMAAVFAGTRYILGYLGRASALKQLSQQTNNRVLELKTL
jgi:hypothetical protein